MTSCSSAPFSPNQASRCRARRFACAGRTRSICAVILLVALAVAGASAGDQKRESQLRTVLGTVVDKQDAPIPSSVVYLKNLRTLTVKTHIADDTGRYRFSGLDPNVDYEIYAEP